MQISRVDTEIHLIKLFENNVNCASMIISYFRYAALTLVILAIDTFNSFASYW